MKPSLIASARGSAGPEQFLLGLLDLLDVADDLVLDFPVGHVPGGQRSVLGGR